jgi:hypothetical protein
MNLKDKAMKCNGAVIDFMKDREKGAELQNKQLMTLIDFDFLNGTDDNGEQTEYSAMIFKEDKDNFYFGGSVVSPRLKDLKSLMTKEDIAEMKKDGIPVIFDTVKSKKNKGKKYTTCTFYPAI